MLHNYKVSLFREHGYIHYIIMSIIWSSSVYLYINREPQYVSRCVVCGWFIELLKFYKCLIFGLLTIAFSRLVFLQAC